MIDRGRIDAGIGACTGGVCVTVMLMFRLRTDAARELANCLTWRAKIGEATAHTQNVIEHRADTRVSNNLWSNCAAATTTTTATDIHTTKKTVYVT